MPDTFSLPTSRWGVFPCAHLLESMPYVEKARLWEPRLSTIPSNSTHWLRRLAAMWDLLNVRVSDTMLDAADEAPAAFCDFETDDPGELCNSKTPVETWSASPSINIVEEESMT